MRNTLSKFLILCMLFNPALLLAEQAKSPESAFDMNSLFEDYAQLPPVSLPDLLVELHDKNPEILAAKAKWKAASKKKWIDSALPDPMVGFDLMGEMTETRVGPQENRLAISQEIPFPAKLYEKWRRGKEMGKAARAEYEATMREQENKLKRYYYDLYFADGSVEIIRNIYELLSKFENVAGSRYADGSGAQRDVAKSQAEVSLTLEQLFILRQRRESIIARMNSLLSRSPLDNLGQAQKPDLMTVSQTLIELINVAAENRQEIKSSAANVQENKHETHLAWMENLPDLQTGFVYTWVGDGMTSSAEDGKDSWMFPLMFRVPLWQNRIIPEIQAAKQELKAAEAKFEGVKNKTFYEVRDAYVKYQTSHKLVSLYESAIVPQAELALNSDKAGYEAGRSDFLNLLDSQRVYLNAQLSYLKIYVETLKSYADLERAVGIDLGGQK